MLKIKFHFQVAWSVVRTTRFTGAGRPVQFPVVLVNEGNAWQTTSHTVIIPRQGYYFLHIGGGIDVNSSMGLGIEINNVRIMSTNRQNSSSNGIDMTSRGGILHLNQGIVLRIGGFYDGAYSDQMKQTIFIGLLL